MTLVREQPGGGDGHNNANRDGNRASVAESWRHEWTTGLHGDLANQSIFETDGTINTQIAFEETAAEAQET